MVRLAKLFGLRQVLIGDSNSEVFRRRDLLSLFDRTTICLGQGGSTATNWLEYFRGPGAGLLRSLRGCTMVWSIGGNHVLKGTVDRARDDLEALHGLTPESYNILIPGVYTDLIAAATGKSERTIAAQIRAVNNLIVSAWRGRSIDTSPAFVGPGGRFLPGLTTDGIHYSDAGADLIADYLRFTKIFN
jgi:hypothetical protein